MRSLKKADGKVLVRIKARPVKGVANEYLINYLAAVFGVRKTAVNLEKGFTGKHKRISLDIEKTEFEKVMNKINEA